MSTIVGGECQNNSKLGKLLPVPIYYPMTGRNPTSKSIPANLGIVNNHQRLEVYIRPMPRSIVKTTAIYVFIKHAYSTYYVTGTVLST